MGCTRAKNGRSTLNGATGCFARGTSDSGFSAGIGDLASPLWKVNFTGSPKREGGTLSICSNEVQIHCGRLGVFCTMCKPARPTVMREQTPGLEAEVPPEMLAALRTGDARRLAPLLANDLQAAALRLKPALSRTLEAGLDAGALGALVSGSGPTCAFLAEDESAAVKLAAALPGSGACRAVRRAHGPVAGVKLVADFDS